MIYFLKKLTTWLLPHVCILCKRISGRQQDICETCLRDLPTATHTCFRCANRLPASTDTPALCGQCIKTSPSFDRTYSLFLYEPPVIRFILNLKFQGMLAHARLFGELLAEKMISEWYQKNPFPSAIIPVPLHKNRLKERGFNQSIEIARHISKKLHLPILINSVIRTKETVPQSTLFASERKQNMHNAFLITRAIKHEHIAIIDDVITTGNTILELSRTLKKHGVKIIDVWCCARAVQNK